MNKILTRLVLYRTVLFIHIFKFKCVYIWKSLQIIRIFLRHFFNCILWYKKENFSFHKTSYLLQGIQSPYSKRTHTHTQTHTNKKHFWFGLMDFNGMSSHLGLFYAERLENNIHGIFVVNGFDNMLTSSEIVLQSYFVRYWSGLHLYFLEWFCFSQKGQNFIHVDIFK